MNQSTHQPACIRYARESSIAASAAVPLMIAEQAEARGARRDA